jgi:transcriptional regulator of acetoin/glycerol metabolism
MSKRAKPPLTHDELRRARTRARAAAERDFLAELIASCDGNVSRAARVSGIRRSYLQKLIARHQLARPTEQS